MRILKRGDTESVGKAIKKIDIRKILGGGYDEFWTHRGRYKLVKGGRGSKKSTTAALWYIYYMMIFWYKFGIQVEVLCLRAYFVNHADSTYAQLQWAIGHLGVSHLFRCYRNPLYIRFIPSGGRIIFKGLDKPDKITSLKSPSGHFAWVWLEEAYEVKSFQAFQKINLSIRGELPKPLFYQATLTFNPYSAKHWLKGRFFDKVDAETGLSVDGRTLAITRNYDCNEFLDAAFLQEMEQIKRDSPNEYNVVGLGQWGHQSGVIFTGCYNIKDILSRTGQSDIRSVIETYSAIGYSLRCGADFGFTNHPTSVIVALVNVKARKLLIIDEIYGYGMTPVVIAKAIRAKGDFLASTPMIADNAHPMEIELIKREKIYGIGHSKKGHGSVIAGIEHMKTFDITVSPKCVNTIIEFENYKWVSAKDDEDKFENEPQDEFNHCMDAIRYLLEDAKAAFFTNQTKMRYAGRGEYNID